MDSKNIFKFGPHDLDTEQKHVSHWHVFVPEGVAFDELLKREAWQNIAYKLRPMARIHVTSESNRFIGELVVVSCGQLWADVRKVSYIEFEEVEVNSSDWCEVRWISNRYKYGIYRKSDGALLEKDLPDQLAASQALANHLSGVRTAV